MATNAPRVVGKAQVAANDVFQEPRGRGLGQGVYHFTLDWIGRGEELGLSGVNERQEVRRRRSVSAAYQDEGHVGEALICVANVLEPEVVEQNLLYNEGGHRLGELCARFHDPKAERDDLRGQKELDDLALVRLGEGEGRMGSDQLSFRNDIGQV